MNKFFKIAALSVIILFMSCGPDKMKSEAEKKSKQFFNYLKQGDETKLADMYKGFKNLDTYYKSDSASVNSVVCSDNITIVLLHNKFTNGYGRLSENDVELFFKQDSLGHLILYDSKGMTNFSEKSEYKFGEKTGCVLPNDTTDQQICVALKKAHELILDKGVEVLTELKRDVVVTDWSWETLYSGSVSGKGIVLNASTFNIPSIKYTITYKNSNGGVITTDKGIVTNDELPSGSSTSFTFYTDYAGGATRASIDLNFDDDLIFNYLANNDWTGKEYEQFLKTTPVETSNSQK